MYRKLKNFFDVISKHLTPKVTSLKTHTNSKLPFKFTMSAKTTSTTSVNTYNAAEAKAFRDELASRTADDWCREGVSLCIPRVFNNISYKRIFTIFKNLRWGFLERVDTIRVQPKDPKKKPYKRAIHPLHPRALQQAQHRGDGSSGAYDRRKRRSARV